jgi:class 3 adenylate cyclase
MPEYESRISGVVFPDRRLRGGNRGERSQYQRAGYRRDVARLDSAARADLPDKAFAYVDSRGHRRLPIHDEAHVRNALARFSQVNFEDDEARERARKRLLNAAKKFRIVPVGFMTGQLQSERELGNRRAKEPPQLPSGFVTMLMTDIESSTALVHRLGDRYGELINDVRSILSDTAAQRLGYVVESRADEFFAVFEGCGSALETAVTIQRELQRRDWPDNVEVRVRIGVHSGYPTINGSNYIGMALHTAARICAAAHGGQILISGDAKEAARGAIPHGVRFRKLGIHRLRGLPDAVALLQITAEGLMSRFPPPRTTTAV